MIWVETVACIRCQIEFKSIVREPSRMVDDECDVMCVYECGKCIFTFESFSRIFSNFSVKFVQTTMKTNQNEKKERNLKEE